ncbi:uncharacterized protein LOC125677648 [Ostrea edulis]|uniref:uncharacterized protein LOC125677648 n=1 Tax=Ostrea edulis TaxID=37623 RepID=UPI0020958827|nr:uncharacterized protein LOC125677648 [Ostrea edulis]
MIPILNNMNFVYVVAFLWVGFPICTALLCSQCYSMTVRNHTNMERWFHSMVPNLYDPQCGIAYHNTRSRTTTPVPQIRNQQPVLPTSCQISAVAGTNTEIRCGFYTGYIETVTHNGVGIASLNIFSMTCFNVDVNVEWACKFREFPVPGDNLHFNRILQNKFSNLVTLTRFVGSVCYCRRSDCTDVINGSSQSKAQTLVTSLLVFFLLLFRRIF